MCCSRSFRASSASPSASNLPRLNWTNSCHGIIHQQSFLYAAGTTADNDRDAAASTIRMDQGRFRWFRIAKHRDHDIGNMKVGGFGTSVHPNQTRGNGHGHLRMDRDANRHAHQPNSWFTDMRAATAGGAVEPHRQHRCPLTNGLCDTDSGPSAYLPIHVDGRRHGRPLPRPMPGPEAVLAFPKLAQPRNGGDSHSG
jgi:hypothetical protein